MSGWTLIIVLAIVLAAGYGGWKYAPKEDQTVWRSSICLTLGMCYAFWAITYLAQLHPLVAPTRSDLRPEV